MKHSDEWLETDGLGGFASGCVDLVPRRRYHSYLSTALTPPVDRRTLLNSFEAWAENSDFRIPLCSFLYAPSTLHPQPGAALIEFSSDPWPRWRFKIPGGGSIIFELFMVKGSSLTCCSWRAEGINKPITLRVRPLLSFRDLHALHHNNKEFNFNALRQAELVSFRPYQQGPAIEFRTNGSYHHDPLWFYNFHYEFDGSRGYDAHEDLAAPGTFEFDLSVEPAVILSSSSYTRLELLTQRGSVYRIFKQFADNERQRRTAFPTLFHRAADQFIVERAPGLSIIAGYPWFADWGRDTCIALRGLCIATGRFDDAATILLRWSQALSKGMIPNRFLDQNQNSAEYNSVDASLWFIIAVYELIQAAPLLEKSITTQLLAATEVILQSYSQGTRFGIVADSDGLLCCGEAGVQLTWMDAKVGDYIVTPRSGKPVELQALWLNALRIGSLLLKNSNTRWDAGFQRGVKTFSERFWNEARSCLYDVIDVDHKFGALDDRIRPNQIFTVGGLPFPILDNERGRLVLECVQQRLLTPMGLRTLAPAERGYAATYNGDQRKRDFSYHQGTAWPWLLGAFIEAWVRLHGGSEKTKHEAQTLFVDPMLKTAPQALQGHLPEIADAEAPFHWRGAPFQAWSLGEYLRIQKLLSVKS